MLKNLWKKLTADKKKKRTSTDSTTNTSTNYSSSTNYSTDPTTSKYSTSSAASTKTTKRKPAVVAEYNEKDKKWRFADCPVVIIDGNKYSCGKLEGSSRNYYYCRMDDPNGKNCPVVLRTKKLWNGKREVCRKEHEHENHQQPKAARKKATKCQKEPPRTPPKRRSPPKPAPRLKSKTTTIRKRVTKETKTSKIPTSAHFVALCEALTNGLGFHTIENKESCWEVEKNISENKNFKMTVTLIQPSYDDLDMQQEILQDAGLFFGDEEYQSDYDANEDYDEYEDYDFDEDGDYAEFFGNE